MGKKSSKKGLDAALAKELNISSQLSHHNDNQLSRSDKRRTVEDLLEIKRYKEMHDDYYSF